MVRSSPLLGPSQGPPSDPAYFPDKPSPSPTLFHSFALDQGPPLLTHCPHHVSLHLTTVPLKSLTEAHHGCWAFCPLWPSPRSPSKLPPTGCCTLTALTPPWGQTPSSLTVANSLPTSLEPESPVLASSLLWYPHAPPHTHALSLSLPLPVARAAPTIYLSFCLPQKSV